MYGNKSIDISVPTLLTAKELIKKVPEEYIISYYLGISDIRPGNSYKSPFRDDRTPSFTIREVNGRFRFRDHGLGFSGDIFEVLQKMYGMSFTGVIKMVQEDLIQEDKSPRDIVKTAPVVREAVPVKFTPVFRRWLDRDQKFWAQFGISVETLKHFNVKPLDGLFIERDGEMISLYMYVRNNVAYSYQFGNRYKFYFPTRDKKGFKPRFLGNTKKEDIQGYTQLPTDGELLVVTKSLKDVMTFYQVGIPAVAPNGERMGINEETIEDLKSRFPNIVSLYDNDMTGKRGAIELKRQHGITPFMIDEQHRKLGIKDISDYVKHFSPL
jgi:DNA primase